MLCPEARVSEHLYGPSVVVTHTTIHALTRGYWPINLARCTLLWRKAGRSLAQSSFFGPDGRSTSYSAPFVRGLRLSAERERERVVAAAFRTRSVRPSVRLWRLRRCPRPRRPTDGLSSGRRRPWATRSLQPV